MFNTADTAHLDDVVSYIVKNYCIDASGKRVRKLLGVGISLGAAILSNYCGKKASDNPFSAVVCVSPHYSSKGFEENISQTSFGLYDYVLGYAYRTKQRKAFEDYDLLKGKKDDLVAPHLRQCRTLTHDITTLVGKVSGYESTQAYRLDSDMRELMKAIRKPTLYISALDDPFMGAKVVPQSVTNDNVLVAVSPIGGHCGWFVGSVYPKAPWWPKMTLRFLTYHASS